MRLRLLLTLATLIFGPTWGITLSQSSVEDIPIAGVWTCDRPPYGIDTLNLDGDRIYFSFVEVVGGQPRRYFGRILYSCSQRGQLEYEVYKVTEGSAVVRSVPYRRYMIYELAENELWTFTDSAAYPDRTFLKVHAYRSTWQSKNIQQYVSSFYNVSEPECVDSILYSIYDHRGVTPGSSYVTVPPKYPGGLPAFDGYIQQKFAPQEPLEDVFGFLTLSCTISCNGTVTKIEVPGGGMNALFPKTLESLKHLIMQMPNWKPALSDYHYVPCRVELPFIVAEGRLRAGDPR